MAHIDDIFVRKYIFTLWVSVYVCLLSFDHQQQLMAHNIGTPVLVQSPAKLSKREPGRYLDGWMLGDTRCCNFGCVAGSKSSPLLYINLRTSFKRRLAPYIALLFSFFFNSANSLDHCNWECHSIFIAVIRSSNRTVSSKELLLCGKDFRQYIFAFTTIWTSWSLGLNFTFMHKPIIIFLR